MTNKKTLVLGASTNPARYSNMAIKKLTAYKHTVVAVGQKAGEVNGIEIITGQPEIENVDTVTLYLNPTNQIPYYDYIISLKPERIIFNPGTENEDLEKLAQQNGIEPVEACTLVMLSAGMY